MNPPRPRPFDPARRPRVGEWIEVPPDRRIPSLPLWPLVGGGVAIAALGVFLVPRLMRPSFSVPPAVATGKAPLEASNVVTTEPKVVPGAPLVRLLPGSGGRRGDPNTLEFRFDVSLGAPGAALRPSDPADWQVVGGRLGACRMDGDTMTVRIDRTGPGSLSLVRLNYAGSAKNPKSASVGGINWGPKVRVSVPDQPRPAKVVKVDRSRRNGRVGQREIKLSGGKRKPDGHPRDWKPPIKDSTSPLVNPPIKPTKSNKVKD